MSHHKFQIQEPRKMTQLSGNSISTLFPNPLDDLALYYNCFATFFSPEYTSKPVMALPLCTFTISNSKFISVFRIPYPAPPVSVPNSPMRNQMKCNPQQVQPPPQQHSQQPPYPDRGVAAADSRKMMNTRAWMNDHRFMSYPQQQYRPGSAVSDFFIIQFFWLFPIWFINSIFYPFICQ